MTVINRNSFNGKFFYEMQKEELEQSMQEIQNRIKLYQKSISGICIPDQEALTELWQAYQTCNFNLNKF